MIEMAIKKVSPLDGLAGPSGGNLKLSELPFIGKVTLRGDSNDKAFIAAVKDVLGFVLPKKALTFKEGKIYSAYWVGPDEWIIYTPEDGETALIGGLHEKLGDIPSQVVNVSDYYVTMRLSGPAAREVIKKGSPLDIHPRSFTTGQCTGTRFAQASIFLIQRDDRPTFDVQVRMSFAEYLWNYFTEAAKEFG